jgi:hypothetical protein
VHVSWADLHKIREFVMVGSDACISFDDVDLVELVRVLERGVKPAAQEEPPSFGEFHLRARDGDVKSPSLSVTEPLKHVSGHFLHGIRRGEPPRTDGGQYRDGVAVMQAVDESRRRNGLPVVVDDVSRRSHRELEPAAR